MPIKNILIRWCLEGFFLRTFDVGFQSGQSGRNPLAGPGSFKRSGHFLRCTIFGKAQKLSVCHKLVKCYCNFQDKFSAHCSSSEIRNTLHLCLFRPDRDHDEKSGRKPSAIDDGDRGAIAPIAPRTSAKNAKQSTTAIAERSLPSRREIRPKTLSD